MMAIISTPVSWLITKVRLSVNIERFTYPVLLSPLREFHFSNWKKDTLNMVTWASKRSEPILNGLMQQLEC